MIVSWNWLKEYVRLDCSVEELTTRLMMAGFNLESVEEKQGDFAIDLEVTSNRPDGLGHLGVAREIAVLFRRELVMPMSDPKEAGSSIVGRVCVEIEADVDWCPQYHARLIEGVTIGPSPDWMQRRLTTVGIRPINNVVDVTNYVMLECGQPLHAFDFSKVQDGRIIVRNARPNEKLLAINHKEYTLSGSHGLIADRRGGLGLAGVMGGAATEIGSATTHVLLEAAEFHAMGIRRTARALDLASDSSYRFERKIDSQNVLWACNRAARLIEETSHGVAAAGVVSVGRLSGGIEQPTGVRLRWSRIHRILGVAISQQEATETLERLGLKLLESDAESGTFAPPTFRRDLTREIDLIEEVGRIHGYADVPENAALPLTAVPRGNAERVRSAVRNMLSGWGYCEAVTFSFVDPEQASAVGLWTTEPPLQLEHSKFRHSNSLRQSLIPSLVHALAFNEARGNKKVGLFEIAHAFFPQKEEEGGVIDFSGLPDEPQLLAFALATVGDDKDLHLWRTVRGHAEAVFRRYCVPVEFHQTEIPGLQAGKAAEIQFQGKRIGAIGYPSSSLAARHELRGLAAVVELNLDALTTAARMVAVVQSVSDRPAVERDLAVVLDEAVKWSAVEALARREAGADLEALEFVDLYRGKQVPTGKKSLAFRLTYRARDRTLTKEEVDVAQQRVVAALASELEGVLRS